MRPDGRAAAALEIIDQVFEGHKPADTLISDYFKARRYAGSKDRRWINERVYGLIRNHAKHVWAAAELGFELNSRLKFIIDGYLKSENLEEFFTGSDFGPVVLSNDEHSFIEKLQNLDFEQCPNWVRLEYPEWLEGELSESLGGDIADAMAALNQKAPVDLRINRLHPEQANAFDILKTDFEDLEKTPFSPMGLRTQASKKIKGLKSFKEGLVDLQDESAQIASLLAGAKGQEIVIDFCAGAGGKTLAMGAEMQNQGTLYALDISARRLQRMRPRLARAGLKNVITQPIKSETDPWLKQFEGRADLVFIDAPCSGTGTWRRQPESRWKLSRLMLEDFKDRQKRILKQASHLLKPGGRLLYATCSILNSENEEQVEAFLEQNNAFDLLDFAKEKEGLFQEISNHNKEYLKLRPDVHGCDGFFAAIIIKRA